MEEYKRLTGVWYYPALVVIILLIATLLTFAIALGVYWVTGEEWPVGVVGIVWLVVTIPLELVGLVWRPPIKYRLDDSGPSSYVD